MGEPLLATWRYGLGQTAAFTSDAEARWAGEWLGWDGYGKFWAQVVRGLLRQSEAATFQVHATEIDGGRRLRLDVDALTPDGGFRDRLPIDITGLDTGDRAIAERAGRAGGTRQLPGGVRPGRRHPGVRRRQRRTGRARRVHDDVFRALTRV